MNFIPKSNRRRFLQQLGIGASAYLLLPFGNSIFRHLFAQTSAAHRFIICTSGDALPNNVHPNFPTRRTRTNLSSMPSGLMDFQPYLQDSLFVGAVDLINYSQWSTDHNPAYALLCGRGTQETKLVPAAATFDHYAGASLSTQAPFSSVLFSSCRQPYSSWNPRDNVEGIFAAGENAPIAVPATGQRLYTRLFGSSPSGGGNPENPEPARSTRIFDLITQDIRRLEKNLASEEKEKLEQYLGAIEAIENRYSSLPDPSAGANCSDVDVAFGSTPDDDLDSMMELGTFALNCGLTNVVGIDFWANDIGHGTFPNFRRSHSSVNNGQGFGEVGTNGYPITHDANYTANIWWPVVTSKITRSLRAMMESLSDPGKAYNANANFPASADFPENTTLLFLMPKAHIDNHHRFTPGTTALIISRGSSIATGGQVVREDRGVWHAGTIYRGIAQGLGISLPAGYGQWSGGAPHQFFG